MQKLTKIFAMALTSSVLSVASVAEATARERWNEGDGCYELVEGIGSATGVFGRGTERARWLAQRDWERNASDRYGPSYGRFYRASDVNFDCKRPALLRARCVVTARPCRSRMRG